MGIRPVAWDSLHEPGSVTKGHAQVLRLPRLRGPQRLEAAPAARAGSVPRPPESRDPPPAAPPGRDLPRPRARPRKLWWLVPVGAVLLAVAAAAVVWFPRRPPLPAASPLPGPAGPEEIVEIGEAMRDMRAGLAHWSLRRLRSLRERNPDLAPIDYVTALAAVEARDTATAASSIEATLAKGQRVSDALALRAALETMRAPVGDPEAAESARVRAEAHLRQAIAADTANPAPFVDLAVLLRGRGESAEARRLLEAARSRIHPVDPLTVIEVTLLLISLEGLPDADLPGDLDPDRDTASLLGAAYVALRRGNNARAAELLRTARERLPESLYHYLVGDPEFRRYVSDPALAPLFQ